MTESGAPFQRAGSKRNKGGLAARTSMPLKIEVKHQLCILAVNAPSEADPATSSVHHAGYLEASPHRSTASLLLEATIYPIVEMASSQFNKSE